MLKSVVGTTIALLAVAPAFALTGLDKYHVTEAEKIACSGDAISLCGGVAQDEDRLLACMRVNRSSLTPACGRVFDEGLQRRGLR